MAAGSPEDDARRSSPLPEPDRSEATAATGTTIARLILDTALALFSAALFIDAGQLPASRWEPLGSGSFPQIVFALLGLLAAFSAVGSLRLLLATRHSFDASGVRALPVRWLRERYLVVLLFVLFGLYLAAVPRLGFSIATFGFMLVAGALLAPRTPRAWLIAVVLALVFSFGLNLLFAEVFDVFLPRAPA